MDIENMYKKISGTDKLDEKSRAELIEYLKTQLEKAKEEGVDEKAISYEIAGLLSLDAVRSLPEDDDILQVATIAGELELPEEHRSADVSWQKMSEKIEEL